MKGSMKLNHSLNTFISAGTIFLSLNPGTGNFAQELPAQPPLTITTTPTILPPPASPKAPKLADSSADGEFYVCATRDGRIKYGRTEEGVKPRTFHICQPEAVALSPDGRWLAAAGNSNGCRSKLKVWNVKDGSLLWKLETEVGSESLLRFSPDGMFLASTTGTTAGSRIDLWHLGDGEIKWSKTFPKNISHLAFTSQSCGALVVVCEDGKAMSFPLP
jgi:WD40 repeat protein